MFLPLYSLVMDWVFPLKLSYRIESLRIWEHLMYVLHVLICGDNGIFMWSTWCMFWWSTCGFSELVNLCIGVGTRICNTLDVTCPNWAIYQLVLHPILVGFYHVWPHLVWLGGLFFSLSCSPYHIAFVPLVILHSILIMCMLWSHTFYLVGTLASLF